MAHWMNPAWLALLLVVVYFGFLFTVAQRELRYTCPYILLAPAGADGGRVLSYSSEMPDVFEASDYVRLMGHDAMAAGFAYGGSLAHAKLPRIRIVSTLWCSEDRRTLVLTGSGRVFGIPARQTWLFSPLGDGRVLVTTDNNDEGDVSRRFRYSRLINVRFDRLLAAHRRRIAQSGADVVSFVTASPLDDLLGLYDRRVRWMVDHGLARYVDAEGTYWRYTPRGALRVCLNFFPQLLGSLPQFWRVNRRPIASIKLHTPT